ncbi:MAG: RagB/SusD family nutrient uptake outer membrane protein [Bacteroidaceae bacterium]|nr:RagB/SusD family nutrient uptake outer membrane protein [Bacteroidaceae bacterium]
MTTIIRKLLNTFFRFEASLWAERCSLPGRAVRGSSFLLLLFLFTSCNDWLNVQPRSQVEDTELFTTEGGFKEALAGVYSSMVSSSTYAKEMTYGFMAVLGHEWDYYYSSQYDDVAAFNYDASYPTNYIRQIWANSYSGIANVNNLLGHIDENPRLFSADNHDVIKGEALALRAFLHFDLLRCFGVSYAVNPDQPSIPYSTALSYRVFPQLTVAEAAGRVLADLQEAEALLQGADPIVTGREVTESTDNGYLLNRQLHLNYYAVKGLQARVLMWMGRYDEALQAANVVIQSEQFAWADVASLQSGADRCLATEHLFALNNLTMQADVSDLYFDDGSQYSFAVTRDRLLDYFDNATQDYRYTFLFKSGTATHANNRYLMKYDAPSGSAVYYNYKMPLIRLSEMYLIRSEVQYRQGDADAARATLNTLRVARNLPALNELPADYYTELVREYRREFMGEGQLFFLYKRLNRSTILFAEVDAVAEKVYTFPLPITETEAAQREANK